MAKSKNNPKKRAFFTDPLVLAFAIIAIFLLIVIFSFAISAIKEKGAYNIKGLELDSEADAELNQILKTPVSIEGYKTDIAGLIIYSGKDTGRQEKLKTELKRILRIVSDKAIRKCPTIRITGTSEDVLEKEILVSAPEDSFFFNGCAGKSAGKAIVRLPSGAGAYEVVFTTYENK